MAIDYRKWELGKQNLSDSIEKLETAVTKALKRLGPEITDYDSAQKEELVKLQKSLGQLRESAKTGPQGEMVSVRNSLETLEKAGEIFAYKASGGTFGDLVAEEIADDTLDKKAVLKSHLSRIDRELGTALAPDARMEEERRQREELEKDASVLYHKNMKADGTALESIDALKKGISPKLPPLVLKERITAMLAARMAVDSERGVKKSLKKPLTEKAFSDAYVKLWRDEKLQDFIATLPGDQLQKAINAGHGGALEDLYREHNATLDKLPDDLETRFSPTVGQRIEFLEAKLQGVSENSNERERYEAELRACREMGTDKASLARPVDPRALNREAAKQVGNNEVKDAGRANAVPEIDAPKADKSGKPITALEYIDRLKKEIGSKKFDAYDDSVKREKYIELLAARMAVNSKRGDKSSLKHPISRAAMEQARQTLKNDPTMKKILDSGNDSELRAAITVGHGGAAEDLLQRRADAVSQYDPNMPERFKPRCPRTYDEAARELGKMAQDKANGLAVSEGRYNRYIAYTAYLATAETTGGKTDQKAVTEAADQIMTSAAYKHFCNRWKDPEDLLTQAKPGYNMRNNFSKIFGQSVKMSQQAEQTRPALQNRNQDKSMDDPEQQLEQGIGF